MADARIAIVTGASRGIGAATAREFASRGYSVTLVGQDHEALAEVKRHVEAFAVETLVYVGDLANLEFAESVVSGTIERWGRVDVLVNNAAWREIATMRTIGLDSWEKTLRVCLTAPAFLARWAAADMESRGSGVIVNISSIMSKQAAGFCPAYIACKGALDALTYELAALYGPAGLRVLGINPGAIDTAMSRQLGEVDSNDDEAVRQFSEDMIMLRRWGASEEIARAVAWVASDEASYLTGTSIVIDGGWQRQHFPYSLKHQQLPAQFP
jgi:3-oxoacyl-[acyl-carrier protein] reductase